jgi:hypothetical protein
MIDLREKPKARESGLVNLGRDKQKNAIPSITFGEA